VTRRDYWYAGGLSLVSFVLCAIRYWYPPDRYFDEVYYPRSAAEYLLGQSQYEWTHPPLTKLLIALSIQLWGGAHSALGDSGYGWRFANLIVGAALVFLVYAFAKRLTGSTPFAAIAGALLVLDGFHFAQSRIATPEITVAFFALAILYAFYRYWQQVGESSAGPPVPVRKLALAAGFALFAGSAAAYVFIGVLGRQSGAAVALMACLFILAAYTVLRTRIAGFGPGAGWLWATAILCGLGAASKWNVLFDVLLVCAFACAIPYMQGMRARIPVDVFLSAVFSATIAIYLAAYIPFFLTPQPATYEARNDLTGLMDLQYQMYTYHDVTVTRNAPHPYSSKWWEWPLLIQPIAYWYKDFRLPQSAQVASACCVAEIIALPNPVSWWFGLLSVPLMGALAWLTVRRGLLLLYVAYFAQWLPWIASPRMLFEYHFFPNDAVIILADTVALKWLYDLARKRGPEEERIARSGIGVFLLACLAAFVYFYPVLAADHIPYNVWLSRMWFRHWIIGPG